MTANCMGILSFIIRTAQKAAVPTAADCPRTALLNPAGQCQFSIQMSRLREAYAPGAGKDPRRPSPPQNRTAQNRTQTWAPPSISWLQSLLVSISIGKSTSPSQLSGSGTCACSPCTSSKHCIPACYRQDSAAQDITCERHKTQRTADDRFKGSAFKKVADIINSYPEKITSGKQVSHVKGVGKGSIAKVRDGSFC